MSSFTKKLGLNSDRKGSGGSPLPPLLSARPSASLYVFFAKTEMRAIFIIYSPAVAGQDKTQNVFLPHPTQRENFFSLYFSRKFKNEEMENGFRKKWPKWWKLADLN